MLEGSGSITLTCGSESRGSKNMWNRIRIRIRNTGKKSLTSKQNKVHIFLCEKVEEDNSLFSGRRKKEKKEIEFRE
jgi:hypothetical protein